MVARSSTRSLAVAAAAVAVVTLAGCSMIPGLQPADSPPPPPAGAKAPAAPKASAKPASGKTLESVPATGLPLAKPRPARPDVDGIRARDLVADGARLIDVRDRMPFKKERIKGAVNVPMWRFTKDAAGWDRDKPVVVCDQTGAQARTAVTWLQQHGFTKVYYLVGGVDGWDATLVGTEPREVPVKEPVVYYFHIDDDTLEQLTTYMGNDFQAAVTSVQDQLDTYLKDLQEEFPNGFALRKYDLSTDEGAERWRDFDGRHIPMFVLVDENGEELRTRKEIDLVKLRADLQRAVNAYKDATK